MGKHLAVRADADSRMGTGHIMRCIALGQAWQDIGGAVDFYTSCDNDNLLQRLRDEQFSIIKVSGDQEFISSLTTASWVVMDGYHFSLNLQRSLREAGFKLLLIDDYNHLPEYECDILLNQNVGSEFFRYHCNPNCRKLLGSPYALLRREFRATEHHAQTYTPLGNKLLITLGGADPDNITLQVVKALLSLGRTELHTKIVVGPANPYREILEDAILHKRSTIELLEAVKDMPSLMRWADLALSAGGSTCWELCRLGVPFATVVLAENQKLLTLELEQRGVASCLGAHPTRDNIADWLRSTLDDEEERQKSSQAGMSLIDPFGVDRALAMPAQQSGLELLGLRLTIRPAIPDDMELYWNWANDADVRCNSYNPESIMLPRHRQWFAQKLASNDVLMLVLELDGIAVGQVRYERKQNFALLGFSIDARFRGMGLGQWIVELSQTEVFDTFDIGSIRAEVFASNLASQSVFEKSGFILKDTCEIKGIPSLVYEKQR